MQIVIDLPDENYQVTLTKIMLACYGCRIIELPKGHGRLKDIDKIERLLDLENPDNKIAKALKNIIESVPTIIEADKDQE